MISVIDFAEKYNDLCLDILKDLCGIPAPSGLEDNRANYCLKFLKDCGYDNAYIDSAKNVICFLEGENKKYNAYLAHTDTVFPDLTPLPYEDDGTLIKCPGVGDDTVCVAQMLCVAKYLKEIDYKPKKSIMFVANSCEEGLGNLKGSRQIFKDFDGKIDFMITFDGKYNFIGNMCVGSHRYLVKAITEGGHSFSKFGNRNAIAVLSNIVNDIYSIEVPNKPDTKTTYNVGTISGGTSVNTIAQSAEMLCEYRSDDKECLSIMTNNFNQIFKKAEDKCLSLEVKLIGDRPCMGNVNKEELALVSKKCADIQFKYNGNKQVLFGSESTDCNIPYSLGIAAICMGTYDGTGSHTREEYIVKKSVKEGLSIVLDTVLTF
ncbi:MAG: M20/M25/M40 family metallo-hydrolase [Clostridia bacterium]|nr:M20/M25/M40 family metallo-hydrolase [Clostridia bacterium]